MNQQQSLVMLVTSSSPQTQLFIDYLGQQLSCPIVSVTPEDTRRSITGRTVVLLDIDYLDEGAIQEWHSLSSEHPDDITLAAFNLRNEDHAVEVLSSVNLQGVFYHSDSLAMICKGLNALMDRDLWMSRSLMTRMIQFFRRQQLNSYRPACGLTQRELEIIAMLGTGASNTRIAEQLFVSEHTVKSHLYNIFRKIEVHNRVQAVNWARQHLGAPPPLASRHQSDKPAAKPMPT